MGPDDKKWKYHSKSFREDNPNEWNLTTIPTGSFDESGVFSPFLPSPGEVAKSSTPIVPHDTMRLPCVLLVCTAIVCAIC